MAFEKFKDYLNKGLEVSKNALDKGVEASKDALNKAGNAVQDFSDKSVVRIEKKQFEGKRHDAVFRLGDAVLKKIDAGSSQTVSADDPELVPILEEIKKFDAEILKRDVLLFEKSGKAGKGDDKEEASQTGASQGAQSSACDGSSATDAASSSGEEKGEAASD